MKNKKTLIITAAILLILLIGYRASSKTSSETSSALSYDEIEYTAVKDSISVSVKGSGSVYPSDRRTVKSETDGVVEKIYVSEGDSIENNQVLISLKSKSDSNNQIQTKELSLNIEKARKNLNQLYDKNSDLTIYADSSGVVSGLKIKDGDQISINYSVCIIKDTESAYVEAYFSKEQYEKIKIGDEASVFLTRYFVTESGVVHDIDSTPIPLGAGIFGYRITVKITNPGGYSQDEPAQLTVTNSEGSFINMNNGKISEMKGNIVTSSRSGKVKSVNVKNGKQVTKGDIIAVLEEEDTELQITEQINLIDKYQTQLNDLQEGDTVYSPMRGTVLSIAVSEEEVVGRTSVLMTVADLDMMEVVLAVDELDITKIRLGQKANVTSDVFKDESFTGSVSKISMEGKNQNGVTTYDVTVLLDERKALMSGMNVDIEILADNRSDAIIVPVDAIRKSNGSYIVTVRDESGKASDIEVKLGIANKNFAEVVNGINEGDIIVYGKIQNKSSSMFNGGMMSIRGGR